MSDNTNELKKKARKGVVVEEANGKEEAEKIGATPDEEEKADKEEADKAAASEEKKEKKGEKEAVVEGEGKRKARKERKVRKKQLLKVKEKKEGEEEKQDRFMDIVDEINNTYADEEENSEKDI
ncbi:protein PXR1-like [Capsicum annuum]|uniref:protein PXR1-like n=1 Tax=Capsicum annuum TaxID=4072 RepID=UPI001FB0E50A|nr:protein PXR1-like [Capsicum annuum]